MNEKLFAKEHAIEEGPVNAAFAKERLVDSSELSKTDPTRASYLESATAVSAVAKLRSRHEAWPRFPAIASAPKTDQAQPAAPMNPACPPSDA